MRFPIFGQSSSDLVPLEALCNPRSIIVSNPGSAAHIQCSLYSTSPVLSMLRAPLKIFVAQRVCAATSSIPIRKSRAVSGQVENVNLTAILPVKSAKFCFSAMPPSGEINEDLRVYQSTFVPATPSTHGPFSVPVVDRSL